MKFLNIIAEGKTEEEFVRKTLTPYLANFEVFVSCQRVHTGGTKLHPIKGGLGRIPKYRPVIRALERWRETEKNRNNVFYSTMLDLYAFPKDEESPYSQRIQNIPDKYQRIEELENAMAQLHNCPTFIPYVQLHEFETLLLVDVSKLSVVFPEHQNSIEKFKVQMNGKNVELINDRPELSPSNRITSYIPEYQSQKSTIGPMIAEDIGIQNLKMKCQHFNQWITKLENL
ncbi:MAG: DUF4276 family protein [Flavobacteriales bacterium]|nr:MAG: DUF4276 family protein [Flavobacteriales bacterium]